MVELLELSEVTFESLRLCLICIDWVFFSLAIFGKFILNFQWLVFLYKNPGG